MISNHRESFLFQIMAWHRSIQRQAARTHCMSSCKLCQRRLRRTTWCHWTGNSKITSRYRRLYIYFTYCRSRFPPWWTLHSCWQTKQAFEKQAENWRTKKQNDKTKKKQTTKRIIKSKKHPARSLLNLPAIGRSSALSCQIPLDLSSKRAADVVFWEKKRFCPGKKRRMFMCLLEVML